MGMYYMANKLTKELALTDFPTNLQNANDASIRASRGNLES
jgi:hypothetical protein